MKKRRGPTAARTGGDLPSPRLQAVGPQIEDRKSQTAHTGPYGRAGRMAANPRPPAGLLNRSAVRRLALDLVAQAGRREVITRVGETVYADLAAGIRRRLRTLIDQHPSAFRTLET